MEVSLSFMAWLSVVIFQVLVHLKVVYFRRGRDEDEPRMIEAVNVLVSESESEMNTEKDREPLLSDLTNNPSIDDEDDDDYNYDDPPNLRKRLSQTGSEMMSVSARVRWCTHLRSSLVEANILMCLSCRVVNHWRLWCTSKWTKYWPNKNWAFALPCTLGQWPSACLATPSKWNVYTIMLRHGQATGQVKHSPQCQLLMCRTCSAVLACLVLFIRLLTCWLDTTSFLCLSEWHFSAIYMHLNIWTDTTFKLSVLPQYRLNPSDGASPVT